MRPDSHSGHDEGDDAPAESGRESKSELNKPRGCRQAALGQDIVSYYLLVGRHTTAHLAGCSRSK